MKVKNISISEENFAFELIKPNFFEFHKNESLVKEDVEEITNSPLFSFEFGDLKNINFFIGANNSGKSRFLRGLMRLDSLQTIVYEVNSYMQIVDDIDNHVLFSEEFSSFKSRSDYNEILNLVKTQIPKYQNLKGLSAIKNDTIKRIDNCLEVLLSFDEINLGTAIYKPLQELIFKIKVLREELKFCKNNRFEHKIYIPVLRSLFRSENLNENDYSDLLKKYFKISSPPIQVETGLALWTSIYNLQNSPKKRDLERFQDFLSANFFDGKSIELLADHEKNLLSISVDREEYRGINEIGDGIQQIIMLTFPIFLAKKNTWVFIEEPEMNLHPGYQRIFIETLINDEYLINKNLKYFITTHSNHFLDLTLKNENTAIFQFEKLSENRHQIKSNITPNKETLEVLGVNTSSVFLANTSIWMEGPTDRKYISHYIKLYCEYRKELYLKEDIDFSFFEYGGNLIQHYLFDKDIDFSGEKVREKINSFALSNKIYLLADDDNVDKQSAKGKRRKLLEENATNNSNFFYQNTEVKEVENLLPKSIVKDFISYLVKDYEGKELINEIEFNKQDYDKVGLGEFYEKLLLDNKIPKKHHKAFKADSGTLKNDYKIKLADFVINSDYKYEDFIEGNNTLKTIIEDLYKFIKK